VAAAEYARLNTGGSITPGNSENGALLTLNGKNVGNKNIAPNDRASVGLPCSCVSITFARFIVNANHCKSQQSRFEWGLCLSD